MLHHFVHMHDSSPDLTDSQELKEALEKNDDKAAQMSQIAACLMQLTNLGMEDQVHAQM